MEKGKYLNKKWMPRAAGILEIMAGFWMVISSYFLADLSQPPLESWSPFWILWLSALFILGVLALAGGIFASKQRKWALAFAGAVVAITIPFITFSVIVWWAESLHNIPPPYTYGLEVLLSISPLILLVLSKREFK